MSDPHSDSDPDPVVLEITDVLDLHSFPPRQVADVVGAYLDEAVRLGLRTVRIIHGKGIGAQRRTVRAVLSRDDRVKSFSDAPEGAGGWGATCVILGSESPD